jgi:uncharacterized membrane protein YqjE
MEDTGKTASGGLGEYAYTRPSDRSVGDLVRDIVSNAQEMVRSELRLAKAELREETSKTLASAKKMGIAAGAGIFAIMFVLVGVTLLLSLALPMWLAFLIVGGVLGIVAAALFSSAKQALHVPVPEKTVENVKENVEWMKNQTRS